MVCAICLDTRTDNFVKIFDCSHQYHNICINQWNSSCPLCRANRTNIFNYYKNLCYNFQVTPEKYLSTFKDSCKANNHMIEISKPYGVLLICKTCGFKKSYNWFK